MAAFLLSATTARAQDGPEIDGLFITVHNPITTNVVNRVKAKTTRFLQRPDHRGLVIVYDFNPDQHPSSTSDYGPCHDLAAFLLDQHSVTTVAFVHNETTGHTVLPVLACKDIVMSSEARLGDAMREQNKPLDKDQQLFYSLVAERRGRFPAVVLKMADANVEVVEGARRGAVAYVDPRQLAREENQGVVLPPNVQPVLAAGNVGLYSTVQAQKFGLCNLRKGSRQELAEAYRLPARSLREDPLEGRTPVACLIVVKGVVNAALRETLERRMRRAIGTRGVNCFVLQLECGGGDTQVARELADFLHDELRDDSGNHSVMTVAYVTEQARDTAVYLALGCSEIVMDRRAKLGGFEQLIAERPKYLDPIRQQLEELAQRQGYSPLLARAFVDPQLALHRVSSQVGQPESKLLDDNQLKEDHNGPKKWRDDGQIKAPGEWFTLDAELAKDPVVGIARHVVEGPPAEALLKIYALYGLENVREARLDWIDELALFLRNPVVSVFLVMIGIIGLILELKIPGAGFPGVVAALCFVLYFWAHSQLAGHVTMLAVLLFVLGLILIALEIFVIPGFGITGLSGVALVLVSLALAAVAKKPETTQEWVEFGTTISHFGLSMILAIVAALVLVWYLPHIPYANRLVLAPPGTGVEETEALAVNDRYAALLGAIGEAATTLRPAGKVRFGEEFVDVIAEGSYVHPGSRVQVIEIEGNRIVVKEV
jgi:membrane-bound ClpP family serine protease